jgi:hypothetical protein
LLLVALAVPALLVLVTDPVWLREEEVELEDTVDVLRTVWLVLALIRFPVVAFLPRPLRLPASPGTRILA